MRRGRPRPLFLVPALLSIVSLYGSPGRAQNGDGHENAGRPARTKELEASPAAKQRAELGAALDRLVQARDWRRILARTEKVLETSPDSVVSWQYRAYAYHQLGRLAPAREAYERAISLDPSNAWAHLSHAEVLLREERWDDAVDAAQRAITLLPDSLEARKKLSRADRGQAAYENAILAAHQALEDGLDPAWCHAELGYLTWVLGSVEESRDHWMRAGELGFNEAACAHGLRLAGWESALAAARKETDATPEAGRDRTGEWVFSVGRVEVHTRIGPRLPEEVEQTLLRLQKDLASFLGIRGPWTETVRLHLHRTLEDHDAVRLREYPRGYRGKGFLVQRPLRRGRFGGPRGRGRDRGDRAGDKGPYWQLDMHVAFSEPDLERSLSHELAHALLHVRTPRAMNTAVWFDEGLATYLELHPDARGNLVSESLRSDLLEATRAAKRAGTLLPWRDMLIAQRRQFEGDLAYSRYAQAWAMVYFLVHETSKGRARLRKYIDGLETEGIDWIGGFSRAWSSDLETIDRQFNRWLATTKAK